MVGGTKQSKTDHQTKTQTIKKGMSFSTMPKVVDDMRSNTTAGNLVVSNFDDNTYETGEGGFESFCETILTTNYIWDPRIISRYFTQTISYVCAKNALYRMVVLEFSKLDLKTSQSEREESSDAFRRVMASPGTPIFTAMAYCHYVQTDQWDQDMK